MTSRRRHCNACGSQLDTDDARFCGECGQPVSTLESCSACTYEFVDSSEKFCPNCGAPRRSMAKSSVVTNPPPPVSSTSSSQDLFPAEEKASIPTPPSVDLFPPTPTPPLKLESKSSSKTLVGNDTTTTCTIQNVICTSARSLEAKEALSRSSTTLKDVEVQGDYKTHRLVNGKITKLTKEIKTLSESYYDNRCVKSDDEWKSILHRHQSAGTKFTDPDFGPTTNNWKRISDLFLQKAFVQVSIYNNDDKNHVCGVSIKTEAEYNAISNSFNENSKFIKIAKEVVRTGLERKKREHCLLLTKQMIEHMTEYVDNGKQRFDAMFTDALRHAYAPSEFKTLGVPRAWELDVRVIVVVPIIFEKTKVCSIFDTSATTFQQGSLSDRYLFNAMATVATNADRVSQLFPHDQQYNTEGLYAVRFWREGSFKTVVIDDYIPCDANAKPLYAKLKSDGNLWSVLVEKAYAKLNGGYERIAGGQAQFALEDLTGDYVTTTTIISTTNNDDNDNNSASWNDLKECLESGGLVSCISNDGINTVVRPLCAYGILRLVEIRLDSKELIKLVQLQNCWDKNGDMTGESFNYMSVAQKQQIGMNNDDSGNTWWMEYSKLSSYFNQFLFSRDLLGDPSWSCFSIHGAWKESSSGRDSLHASPQYQVILPEGEGGEIRVTLEQPSRRIRGDVTYDTFIAPVVLTGDKITLGERTLDFSNNLKSGTYVSDRSSALSVSTTKSSSPMVVIPSTLKSIPPSLLLKFHLMIYVNTGAAIYAVDDEATLPVCTVCTKPLVGSYKTFTASSGNKDLVCPDCVEAYRERKLKMCAYCNRRIKVEAGKHDGRFYSVEDGAVFVHSECWESYQKSTAEKCTFCAQPILEIAGVYSGKFMVVSSSSDGKNKKVHEECVRSYEKSTAEKCVQCHESILVVPGKFNGKFYQVKEGGKIHFECLAAYEEANAEKCLHCSGPIMRIEGRFDGRFYDIDGAGKVHFECYQDYIKK